MCAPARSCALASNFPVTGVGPEVREVKTPSGSNGLAANNSVRFNVDPCKLHFVSNLIFSCPVCVLFYLRLVRAIAVRIATTPLQHRHQNLMRLSLLRLKVIFSSSPILKTSCALRLDKQSAKPLRANYHLGPSKDKPSNLIRTMSSGWQQILKRAIRTSYSV